MWRFQVRTSDLYKLYSCGSNMRDFALTFVYALTKSFVVRSQRCNYCMVLLISKLSYFLGEIPWRVINFPRLWALMRKVWKRTSFFRGRHRISRFFKKIVHQKMLFGNVEEPVAPGKVVVVPLFNQHYSKDFSSTLVKLQDSTYECFQTRIFLYWATAGDLTNSSQ